MKKLLAALLVGAGVGLTWPVASQDLSSQVLALLTRTNYWQGVNTYAKTVGLALEPGSFQVTACANRLTNVGSNLYWNCALIQPQSGAGTVTSVGLSLPAAFTVSGSPVTSSGTLTAAWANQSANLVFAGPTSGAATTPTFRSLVSTDIANVNAASLTSGTIPNARFPATYPAGDGSGLTNLNASNLASGTVPNGRFPATLPAASGVNLTALNATQLTSGTVPNAAFPATLPAASGVNLTALNATNLASGSVPCARYTALTGDVTTSGCAATLASTAVTPATYGDATHVAQFAVDAKGRLTNAVAVSITFPTVNLASGVSGVLPPANGGTGASTVPVNGALPIGNGTTYTSATLTGTANQVLVTNGAGSITLATPQDLATASKPQFACLTVGGSGCAGSEVLNYASGQPNPGLTAGGNCGAASTVNWNTGANQSYTLNAAACTLTLSNPISGNTYRLLLSQDGTGGRLVTWPASVLWFGGAAPTLSPTPNATDLCSLTYNGTNYLGRCDLTTGGTVIQSTRSVFTNAQVLALPTTPLTIVAAPAVSTQRNLLLWVDCTTNFSAGAYTNVNATSTLNVVNGSGDVVATPIINNAGASVTYLTTFLGATNTQITLGPPFDGQYAGIRLLGVPFTLSHMVNSAYTLNTTNGGSGAYTGGNAANTLTVTAYYLVR